MLPIEIKLNQFLACLPDGLKRTQLTERSWRESVARKCIVSPTLHIYKKGSHGLLECWYHRQKLQVVGCCHLEGLECPASRWLSDRAS